MFKQLMLLDVTTIEISGTIIHLKSKKFDRLSKTSNILQKLRPKN